MFKVVLNDGQSEMPDDDIYYIIAKEGIYLKKKLGVMESIAPVKNISILNSVTSMAKMHIQPIPGKWIAKVTEFFKAVYKEYRSEAIVLLFYNAETGNYKVIPPMQKVAGASCDYDKGITLEDYAMIGTIHSHGCMSAFHSGIDDKDEEHFDGLHITLGDLNEEYPSVSASIVANGYRVMIEPSEYINDLVLVSEIKQVDNKPVRTIYKIVNGKVIEDKDATSKFTYSYAYRKFDKRYVVNVPDRDKIFNKKWLKMVEKGTYTYKSYNYGQGWGGWMRDWYGYGAHGYTGWGEKYDSHVWQQAKLPIPQTPGTKVSPLNVGVCKSPIKFPPHDQDGEFIPCATCVHRMCKIAIEEDEDENFMDDMYQCTKCGELVKDDGSEMEIQCSKCKTDDHLILLTNDHLENNYIPSNEFDYMFTKDQTPRPSNYIKCKECGNGFHRFEKDMICPFCYCDLEEITDYFSENSLEAQSRQDSGFFLTPEQEEVNSAALKAAREADEIIERIPEPGSNIIPISKKKDGILMSMFRKAFKGERYND